MKRFSFVALFILLASCATVGTEITKNNHQIQMPHYSFVVPSDQEWYLLRTDEKMELAVVTKKLPPFMFEIRMMRNVILDEKVKTWSAEAVADHYRFQEMWGMMTLGVNKGLYNLRDVVIQGEEVIGNKKFYTMTYTTVFKKQRGMEQRAALYLYFPKEENNEWFIIAHFSEVGPTAGTHVKSHRVEFLKMLESVSVGQ